MIRLFVLLLLSAVIGLPHSASGQGSFPTRAKRMDNADLAFVLLGVNPLTSSE